METYEDELRICVEDILERFLNEGFIEGGSF